MIKINVLSEEKSWSKRLKKSQDLFDSICKNFPRSFRFPNKRVYLTLLLSNNKRIKNLNKKFRNKNKTTDVLSFPFYHEHELRKKIKKNNDIYLGDVILNYYKINKVKKENFIYEFNKLWVHGLLHLIGHKHYKNKDFKKMNKLEIKIINKIQNIK